MNNIRGELRKNARELGIREPRDELLDEMERLPRELETDLPASHQIYMMQDGSIAMDIRGRKPDGILVVLKPGQNARCSGELWERAWRTSQRDSRELPDRIHRSELRALPDSIRETDGKE